MLLVCLLVEFIRLWPAIIHFPASAADSYTQVAGPWGAAPKISHLITLSLRIGVIEAALTLICLALTSALAFYVAAIGFAPRILSLVSEFPSARGREQIDGVIGGFMGGCQQVALILWPISSIDPTSDFPLRWYAHLTEKATT